MAQRGVAIWPTHFYHLGFLPRHDTRAQWEAGLQEENLRFKLQRTFRGIFPIRNHTNARVPGEYLGALYDIHLDAGDQAALLPWPACHVSPIHFLIETGRANHPCGLLLFRQVKALIISVVCVELYFGRSMIEVYFTLKHSPQYFFSVVSHFFHTRPRRALTLRMMYFVGRVIRREAKSENNRSAWLAKHGQNCVLATTLDIHLDNTDYGPLKFLFHPKRECMQESPLDVEANLDQVTRLVKLMDDQVFRLKKFDRFYRDEGNLKIPHTRRVRESFMKHVSKKWMQRLSGERWIDFVKKYGVDAEIALRGRPREEIEGFYDSSDMDIISPYDNGANTRSATLKRQAMQVEDSKTKKKNSDEQYLRM